MDPFSITVGCAGLIGGITNLSMHIALFVSQVRSARKDMDSVSSELVSLQLCLEALRSNFQSQRVDYPEVMRSSLPEILKKLRHHHAADARSHRQVPF
jgi:hypothetical protein